MVVNRKIAFSAISIISALSLMAGATFAFFSDAGTSSGNVFTSGNVQLMVDDANETDAHAITASFGDGSTKLAPGTSVSGYISMHNTGSIAINKIKLGAHQDSNTNGGDSSDLATVLNLTVKTGDDNTCTTNQSDLTTTINTALGGVGNLTLAKLNAATYNALPGLSTGSTKYLCINFTMDSGAGNTFQGDSISETFSLEADQDASQ